MKEYDSLAEGCRKYLQDEQITFNPDSPVFDAEAVCKGIVTFMNEEGFELVNSMSTTFLQ